MPQRANVPYYMVFVPPQPAAGANFLFSAPGGEFIRVISTTFTLTTDATVANRGVIIEATDGTTTIFRAGASFTQPASTTYTYALMSGGSDFGNVDTVIHIPSPYYGLLLPPGFVGRSNIVNLQAGDQLSASPGLGEVFPDQRYGEWVPTVERAFYGEG